MPWGLLILRGAGFALAKASDVSGLSEWIGELDLYRFLKRFYLSSRSTNEGFGLIAQLGNTDSDSPCDWLPQ